MTIRQKLSLAIGILIFLAAILLATNVNAQDCKVYRTQWTCWDKLRNFKEDKGVVVIHFNDSTITVRTDHERIIYLYARVVQFRGQKFYEILTTGKGKSFMWIEGDQIIVIRPYNKTTWYKLKL